MGSLLRSCLLRLIATLLVLIPVGLIVGYFSRPMGHSPTITFHVVLAQPARPPPSTRLLLPVPKPPSVAPAAWGTSVLGGPSLSARFIDQVLAQAGSPAA